MLRATAQRCQLTDRTYVDTVSVYTVCVSLCFYHLFYWLRLAHYLIGKCAKSFLTMKTKWKCLHISTIKEKNIGRTILAQMTTYRWHFDTHFAILIAIFCWQIRTNYVMKKSSSLFASERIQHTEGKFKSTQCGYEAQYHSFQLSLSNAYWINLIAIFFILLFVHLNLGSFGL